MTPELLRIDGMGEGIGSLALSAPARPKAGPRALSVLRITDGAKAHFAARIPGKKIYVTADTLAARSMLSKISSHPDVRAVYVPHRDDVLFLVSGRDARSFASQGQQRTVALALKMAEVTLAGEILGSQPILLLDDVMSELDERRRSAVVSFVDGGIQTVVTTTNLGYFSPELLELAKVVSFGE